MTMIFQNIKQLFINQTILASNSDLAIGISQHDIVLNELVFLAVATK